MDGSSCPRAGAVSFGARISARHNVIPLQPKATAIEKAAGIGALRLAGFED
jgi:hypothetical protein